MDDKQFDYINVIPFIDIMLVLLTIVLTTSTFIVQGAIRVELPKATEAETENLKSVCIEIDKTGFIYINSNPVVLDKIGQCLCEVKRDTPILIRADRDIALQAFVDVMDRVKTLGFTKVSLQTEKMR